VKHRAGLSRKLALAASLGLVLHGPAARADPGAPTPIHLTGMTLAEAAARIAAATGAEIVSLERGLAAVRIGPQVLPPDPAHALERLLAGTRFRAVRLGERSFRIERGAPPRRHAPPARRAPAPEPRPDDEITVLAARFPTNLQDYPGTLVRLPTYGNSAFAEPSRLTDLANRSPVVFATAFGDGRDKIFIRGLADSSFNGASQPATAIYFDDARIGFGSPNPSLRLYDVASVEVLEGPQGTLYGAGSIGGAIRITPNPVNLARREVMGSAEALAPFGGQPGWRLAGGVNLPVKADVAGLRVVGYSELDGGFIDDPVAGTDINTVKISGARAAFVLQPDSGLKLDAGAIYQHTQSADAQYVNSAHTLVRAPALPQPFSSELLLARAGLRQQWDSGLELAGVVSFGHRTSLDRFDASLDTLGMGATTYDQQRTSSAWAGEVRLARAVRHGPSWVLGAGLERITDGQSRLFSDSAGVLGLDEVTNITRSASVFAQGRVPLGARLEATLGARYTIARTDSEPARGPVTSSIRGRTARHLDPTLALLYRLDERLSLFARFQTGYRNGGVTVARGIGRVSVFEPDSIAMGELGLRRRRSGDHGLEFSGTLSYARWHNVLAELVTRRGTPITTNIGDARLLALEVAGSWRDRSGWALGTSLIYTGNRLYGPMAQQTARGDRRLPDTPPFSANVDAGYEWPGPGSAIRAISARFRYVGRSVLGPGPDLDLSQGNFAVVDAGISSRNGGLTVRLGLDNVLDTRANRFALGNPITLYRRQGYAPVAPRTLTLAASFAR